MNISNVSNLNVVNKVTNNNTINNHKQDSYESSIMKQIEYAEKSLQNISESKDMTAEEKMARKKEVEDQIQSLKNDLSQYKLQKKREESAKNQKALEENSCRNQDMYIKSDNSITSKDMGLMVSLSGSKEKLKTGQKIKTYLEGKLRTARNGKESSELKTKVENVTKDLYKNMKETRKTITKYRQDETKEKNCVENDKVKANENENDKEEQPLADC